MVSMSCHAAQKAIEIIGNTRYILAIELLCACQAIDLKRPLKTSEPLEKIHRFVRQHIPRLVNDRVMYPEIEAAQNMLKTGKIIEIVKPYLA
jgi:histidine ammonia-lyase